MSNQSDFVIENGVLKKYKGSDADVVIPEGVTAIGKKAFYNCAGIKSVIIPESVQTIGENAFWGCGLTEVRIPGGVKKIGMRAFFDCPLEKLILEEGIQSFDFEALYGCKPRRLVIPDTLTSFRHYDWTFYGIGLVVSDLNRLPAPARWEAAICFAEDGGERTDPRYENHMDFIRSKVSGSAELAAAHPAVLRLMYREKLIPPKSVSAYLKAAQNEKDAELIALLLDYQNELRGEKKRPADTADKPSGEGKNRLFEGQVFAAAGKLNSFENKSELKSFLAANGGELVSTLTEKVDFLILNDPEAEKDKAAEARTLGAQILSECELNKRAGRSFSIIGGVLRRYCGEDAAVTIPEGVSEIGQKAFYKNSALTSVVIPAGVAKIGVRAFAGCEKLTAVRISEGVSAIEEGAFSDCSNLKELSFPESLTLLGIKACYKCSALTEIRIPEGVTGIEEETFYGCSSLVKAAVSENLNWIGKKAFANCAALRDLSLPQHMSGIGEGAFSHCESLAEIRIPAGVTELSPYVFGACVRLRSASIPAGVAKIGENAFCACENLTRIVLPSGLTRIEKDAFTACPAHRDVWIPGTVKTIIKAAFCRKDYLGDWVVPNLTIHAPAGSAAEKYARENHIPFIAE